MTNHSTYRLKTVSSRDSPAGTGSSALLGNGAPVGSNAAAAIATAAASVHPLKAEEKVENLWAYS